MNREELQKVHDALSLLNSMVNCGDQHSSSSVNMTQAAFAILRNSLPPAEGAEEILEGVMVENGFTYVSFPAFVENESSIDVFDIACKAMTEFATLHAQRLAEKMVSERLREELIAYDKFLSNTYWGVGHIVKRDEAVDEYLKQRQP